MMKTVETPTKKKFPAMSPVEQPIHTAASIVLCPGQGAQSVGMGKVWFEQSDTAKRVFGEADRALGYALSEVCFGGPEEKLNRTDFGQLALYVTGVACYESLVERGVVGRVSATAGLSLGEFTSLYIAGAFDFVTGLELVRVRGSAMQEAAESHASGMVALMGADECQAVELCDRARGGQTLVPANFNCRGQVVVSGDLGACERALGVAGEMRLRATALKVAGAFHSPLMRPAADRLGEALGKASWNRPALPVVSNVTAEPHDGRDIEQIKRRLVEQLTRPVRWEQSVRWLLGHVEGDYIELAPGKVLSGLMRRIERQRMVRNYSVPE